MTKEKDNLLPWHIYILYGLLPAFLIIICDQTSKLWVYNLISSHKMMPLIMTDFLNLVASWNRGISFGLFQANSLYGLWALQLITSLITGIMLIWMRYSENRLMSIALGLIVGGALGNIIDRHRFGAVFDFIDFHIAGWHFWTFNIADSAITVGAILLLVSTYYAEKNK